LLEVSFSGVSLISSCLQGGKEKQHPQGAAAAAAPKKAAKKSVPKKAAAAEKKGVAEGTEREDGAKNETSAADAVVPGQGAGKGKTAQKVREKKPAEKKVRLRSQHAGAMRCSPLMSCPVSMLLATLCKIVGLLIPDRLSGRTRTLQRRSLWRRRTRELAPQSVQQTMMTMTLLMTPLLPRKQSARCQRRIRLRHSMLTPQLKRSITLFKGIWS